MKNFPSTPAASFLVAALSSVISSSAEPVRSEPAEPVQVDAFSLGSSDFDFLVGEWRVHHRRLKGRLADSHDWVEFDGICTMRLLMGGAANVEDHLLNAPGGAYRAVGLRSYDARSGQWAIWWLDGRSPLGPLDEPVKGRFEKGVGAFFSNEVFQGKPIRVRYLWSHITPNSARWEQAFSPDEGKTWETNWTMEFQRAK